MGFGFNFLVILVVIPLTGFFLIAWALTRKSVYGKLLDFMWLGIAGLIALSFFLQAILG